jgi:hypothetical protein
MLRYSWTCRCCGQPHAELPIHWGAEAPVYYDALSEAERETRADLSADFCIIDGEHFFIRGVIEIPIVGQSERFTWGVWTSLSAANMDTVRRVWDRPDRQSVGHLFGWLSTALPLYPDTVNLKTNVHINAPPLLPSVELEPTDHPLAVEQRNGMTLERAVAIAEFLLPRH